MYMPMPINENHGNIEKWSIAYESEIGKISLTNGVNAKIPIPIKSEIYFLCEISENRIIPSPIKCRIPKRTYCPGIAKYVTRVIR